MSNLPIPLPVILILVVIGAVMLARFLPSRSSADIKAAVAEGAVVIDVRNQDEWNGGHLEKSTLIPLPSFAGRIKEIEKLVGGDKSKPVIIVCRSGARAGQAKSQLEAKGFTRVFNGGGWGNLRP